MKERGISQEEVETIVRKPEFIKPSVKGRTNAFKFLRGHFVRVTYQTLKDHLLVITVVTRQKPFKEQKE